jgi:hypothetical protein
MLPRRCRGRCGRDVLRLRSALANAALRLRMAFGYIPNVDWLRAQLSRAVALDRARAHMAIAELERCLLLRRTGVPVRCFGPLTR